MISIYLIRDDRFFTNMGDELFIKELISIFKQCLPDCDFYLLEFPYPILDSKSLVLDRCSKGIYKIEICRNFGIGDGQVKSKQLVSRPGFKSIEDQIKEIPSGSYTLIDDDIASGTTIKMIKQILGNKILITKEQTLLEEAWIKHPVLSKKPFNFFDIVDLRDFIVGSPDGGLVVENEKFRVPYLVPFVNNVFRSKIPIEKEKEFSLKVWKANVDFYKRNPKTLENTDPAFKKLMILSGFNENTPMELICEKHLDFLLKN